MSMESAVAFYEKLESDTELTARIQELQTREAIGQYVREELGYDFSSEEMQKVIFERNPEITDEEMEAVVGGVSGDVIVLVSLLGVVATTFTVMGGAVAVGVLALAAAA